MHKGFILKIFVLVTVLIAAGINIHIRRDVSTRASTDIEIRSNLREGDSFKKKESPFLYYEVYHKDILTGYCFNTRDVAPDEKGYGGYIEMLVFLDRLGKITDLKVLRHNETSLYAGGIEDPGFLDQFKGRGNGDRFIIGAGINGITRATISTNAVANTLKSAVDKMQAFVIAKGPAPYGSGQGTNLKEEIALFATNDWRTSKDIFITILLITFLLAAFYYKLVWLKYAGLILSIIYFGFIKAYFISISNLGKIFLWGLPDLWSNIPWYLFIFSGIILTFLFGTFYCSYICPFGGIQVLLKKICRFNIDITLPLARRLRRIRYILLWVFTIVILVLNNPDVVNYEPFSTVFLRRGSIIAWLIVLIIMLVSVFHYRPFCNYFCSVGAFLEILSRFGDEVFTRIFHKQNEIFARRADRLNRYTI